jgi:hypothetical protein
MNDQHCAFPLSHSASWIEVRREMPLYPQERQRRVEPLREATAALLSAYETGLSALNAVMMTPAAVDRPRTRISALLLARASDDLNALTSLIAEGMPVQAAALASVLWEKVHVSNTITHIEGKADDWIRLSESAETWSNFHKATAHQTAYALVQQKIGSPKSWDQALSDYDQLCRMKHAHPFVMRHFGAEWQEDRLQLSTGPMIGGQAQYISIHTCIAATETFLWGIMGFVLGNEDFLPGPQVQAVLDRITSSLDALAVLQNQAPRPPL